MDKNIRTFKLVTGEICITNVEDITDDGMYVLKYPAIVVPVPPQQAGGQQNQVGFGKLMPFSNHSEEMTLNPSSIIVDSYPNKQMLDAYENWVKQIRSMESGIIVPDIKTSENLPKQGQGEPVRDFRKGLNIGR